MSGGLRGIAIPLAVVASIGFAACGGDGGAEGPSIEGNESLFSSSGFEEAVDAAAEEAGDDATLLQVQVTQSGAQFKLLADGGATGFIYTGGRLEDQEVEVIGIGSPEEQGFPLSEVDPGAIDEIRDGVESAAAGDEIELTALGLDTSSVDGGLKWTITAQVDGRTLVFNAQPDGSDVASPQGL